MSAQAIGSIVGLGFSEISRGPIGSTRDAASAAVSAALADAGRALSDVDGLLLARSPAKPSAELPLKLQNDLGLHNLRLYASVEAEGASAIQMIQQAAMALHHGMAKTVVCVFADTPLQPATATGAAAYNRVMPLTGIPQWELQYGMFGAAGPYAMAAQRYLATYNAKPEYFGEFAISNRTWAGLNPDAFLRKPLTIQEYTASRFVVEPFHVLDCAYPVNGAVAIVMVAPDRAGDFAQPPAFVHGMGQGHLGQPGLRGADRELRTGGQLAGEGAYKMAGISARDVTMCQFYDAFSYLGLVSLEDYGLVGRGEAGPFIADGHTRPGGALPVNTGGGHLSGYYLQGVTPIAEAIIQLRGQAGARQVPNTDIALVTGSGGRLDYHAAVILSPMGALS